MNRQQASVSVPAEPVAGTISQRGPVTPVRGLGALRSRPRLSVWVRNPARAADVVALALAISLGIVMFTVPVGSGDFGQWLMVSRSYLGQSVPDYRQIISIPPVMPALLAGLRVFISDPLVALQVFKGVLAAAFVLSAYWAGASVFRLRAAGAVAAVFSFLLTDRLLEVFAFGGLPQLCSLVFLTLAIAAFARASNGPGLRTRWWVAGSLCIVLAAASHTGTGTLAMATGLAAAVASLLRTSQMTWRQRGIALMPLAVALACLAVYWGLIVLPLNQEYSQNPASLAYRGPDKVLQVLVDTTPNVVLLAIGAALLLGGCIYEAFRHRPGAYFIIGAWAASVWGAFALSALLRIATDYPRFTPALVAPLSIAAGGGVAVLMTNLASPLREPFRAWAGTAIPVVLAAAVALNFGPATIAQHEQEAAYYQVDSMPDLRAAAQWLDAQLPADTAVLTTAREGKWIEGFTGRPALFSIQERYSFRDIEQARSIAAETLIRSTTSLSNGYFFVKYADQKSAPAGNVPTEPWIAVNHGGEYLDALRIAAADTSVTSTGPSGQVVTSLGSLSAVTVRSEQGQNGFSCTTSWQGARQGGAVSYQRTITLPNDSDTFDLIDQVSSGFPVQDIQVGLSPVPGMQIVSVGAGDNYVELSFPETGSAEPRIRVSGVDQSVRFEPSGDGVLALAQGDSLHLRFTALTAGKPLYSAGVLSPEQLVDSYDVGAAVLENGESLQSRLARLSALGFAPEKQFGPYVVLVRRSASSDKAGAIAPAPGPSRDYRGGSSG